jgi:alpha-mannosidase
MADDTGVSTGKERRRKVAIVPHTHWDREWYEPFQTFRLRLVRLIDGLVPMLEGDASYTRFLLDGQTAVVDDYLEVRPHQADRLRALAGAGRVAMGPWYVLMDEFLVSGETIVRNLQLGMARGAEYGGAMPVGYLPDMFGHIAQMPQILKLAGLEHAVVWRGVPSSIDKTGFWWEAPDGSTVRAEYLPTGYGNGAAVPSDAKALVRRLTDHEEEIRSFLLDGLLFMNGTDHQSPQPWLGRVVAEANDLQSDLELSITSLPEYLSQAPTEGLQHWRGELRSGFRANVLMGVTSNRVDVKKAAAVAERTLERRAEPYAALFLPPERWPARLFELAWTEMVRNAAHDSICACSVDDVVDAVLGRFATARQIGEGLAEEALSELGRSLATTGPTVVNPTARARAGLVEVVVPGDAPLPGTQALAEEPGTFGIPRGLGAMTLDAATVKTLLMMLPNAAQIDAHTWIQDVRIEEDDTGIDVTIAFGPEERFDVPIAAVKQDLYTRLGARPETVVRVRIDQPVVQRVLACVGEVAPFGWAAFSAVPPEHEVSVTGGGDDGPLHMTNGLVTVDVDATDGTFSLDGTPGFGRLVDGGDHGDSYNYSPPATDRIVDRPDSVSVSVRERGPLRAVVEIETTYTWPEYVDGRTRSRAGATTASVSTELELRADDGLVRVRTRFTNPSRDHRLRVHFPLPEPADFSEAECAFAVVRRGLDAEGRPDELGIPTFPSRRFVTAGGLTVLHEGLNEYELVDTEGSGEEARATTLAVTLLRATGMLSRLGMAYRPLPAGPLTPVAGLQLLGAVIEARYAIGLHVDDPFRAADDAFLPLEVVHSLGAGSRPATGSLLEVSGAEVSSVRRAAGSLEVRVFNPTPQPATVGIGDRSAWLVDLRGRPESSVDGSFELRPFGIATLRFAT